MAKLAFDAGEEYALRLSRLAGGSEEIAKKAIYAAANIVANRVKENIRALPAVNDLDNIHAYQAGEKMHLTVAQKRGLIESFGISPFAMDNGYMNVKLGFDGYNDVKTKTYPKGQPNQMIARVAESGSSYMDATPFMRTGVNATRKAAVDEMQKVIDEEIEKIMQ